MDYQLFQYINGLAGRWDILDYTMIFAAQVLILFLGFGIVALSITRVKEWGKELFFDAVIGVCAALFLNWLVPLFYIRRRPFIDHAVKQLLPMDPASKSFPSDHAAISFAIAAAVFQYNKFWGIIFFILASIVSIGRIYGGIHYPVDIIAGAAIGIIASITIKRLLDYLLRKKNDKARIPDSRNPIISK